MNNFFDTVKNEGYVDGQLYRDHNEWRRAMAAKGYSTGEGGGGGGGALANIPAFNFDWEAARKAAFDPDNPQASVLGRYYLQKLKDSGDDTARAKRLIEEDYSRGVRIAGEDYARTEKYGKEDLESELAGFGLESTEERRNAIARANQRGVLLAQMPYDGGSSRAPYSEYAQGYILSPLEQRQALRKQAIERAIQRQTEIARAGKERETERLGVAKTRGVEEQNIQYPRTQQQLQEETRAKAYTQIVPQQYQEQYQKFRAAQGLS